MPVQDRTRPACEAPAPCDDATPEMLQDVACSDLPLAHSDGPNGPRQHGADATLDILPTTPAPMPHAGGGVACVLPDRSALIARVCCLELDAGWRIVSMNAEGLRIADQRATEVIGREFWQVWPALRGTGLEHCFFRVRHKRVPESFEYAVRRSGGVKLWLDLLVNPLSDGGLEIFFRDISSRVEAIEVLQAQSLKLQIATDAAELGFFDHDLSRNELYWSDRLCMQIGVPVGSKVTRETLMARLHPEDRERMQGVFERLFAPGGDGRYHAEYRTTGIDGSERWISARGQVYYDRLGQPLRLFGVTMDISERKLLDRKMQEAAQHDDLTGLPTRALLIEHCRHILARSARSGESGAVIFIDLDRFKPVNDLYGHDVGDEVLATVTNRLLLCTRKEDVVSRHGGDEFIVVLPQIESAEDAMRVAHNILQAVDEPILVGSLTLNVSASIGISIFPDHAQDLDVLIRCADLAMYAAKKSGRNAARFYSAGHDEHASHLLRLEVQVRNALQAGTMQLFYQPIIDVLTGKLICVEALIRMRGSDGLMMLPADVIPVAETAGLINPLGNWVIREACRQHRQWCAAGLPPLSIAVNVSPSQFRQASFTATLAQAIAEFGVDPAYLQIELTEGAIMDNVAETVVKLAALQAMGIQISLDDFGTGYSSLSYLSRLPLDKLKIDQSFIRSLDSKSSRSITEAIISLGHTLNLTVVGEGIESAQAMGYLREYGCNQVQGFLFSEALPPAQFVAWYRSHCT